MKNLLTSCSIAFLIIACGSNTTNQQEAAQEQSAFTKDNASSDISPCELINKDAIRSMFGVPVAFKITMEDKMRTYPTCVFKWKDETLIKTKDIGGRKITTVLPQEVMIVLVANANDHMWKPSTKVYKDGVNIEGLGNKAIWGDQMHQLTVLANGYMFHVNVMVSTEAAINKAKAIEVANTLIAKL